MLSLSIPRIRRFTPAVIAAVAALALAVPAVASAAEFSLTINVEPGAEAGAVECEVNGGGVEPCEAEYEEGDEVNLVPEAEPGYEFIEFSGDCGPIACELEMNENHEVTTVFELTETPEFALEIETGGEGEGEVLCAVAPLGLPELCEAEYPEGTQLTLLAEPEIGSLFEEWAGDCSGAGSETECELEMDGEKAVEAIFGLEPTEFALNIEETGGGEGTVTCEAEEGSGPCPPEYPVGTVVYLTAEAETGSEFVEWEEGCDSVSGPNGEVCEVEMNEERAVAVVFELELETGEFSLTITKAGSGSGEVECEVDGGEAETCEAKYLEGTEIALVATADPGSTFAGFSGGTGSAAGCSTSPCTFTIEASSKVKATFNTTASPPTVTSVSPNKGTTAGGTVVTITGTNLTGATAVKFGATAATGVEVKSATEVKATSPAHAAGEVD
ncbi:MAG TPA: IPT/TIG domain-containing protein, partial [Solirubrobacterales bacterium]